MSDRWKTSALQLDRAHKFLSFLLFPSSVNITDLLVLLLPSSVNRGLLIDYSSSHQPPFHPVPNLACYHNFVILVTSQEGYSFSAKATMVETFIIIKEQEAINGMGADNTEILSVSNSIQEPTALGKQYGYKNQRLWHKINRIFFQAYNYPRFLVACPQPHLRKPPVGTQEGWTYFANAYARPFYLTHRGGETKLTFGDKKTISIKNSIIPVLDRA